MTPEFDKFCKENSILIECMPPHSSHLHQPLDVGCFSVLKRVYGDLVRGKMAVGIHHIDKPLCLELFFEAYTKAPKTPKAQEARMEAQGGEVTVV
ncbi:hypothetical protein N657DRAFT_640562, partial [Parathielavia appendiculata]